VQIHPELVLEEFRFCNKPGKSEMSVPGEALLWCCCMIGPLLGSCTMELFEMPPNCHFDSLNLVGIQAQDPGQLKKRNS
jgi:hypothetical protein